jgi:uncharacterized membrane protein
MPTADELAHKFLDKPYGTLDALTQKVTRHIAERQHITRNLGADDAADASLGARAADAVARFGGSWVFIGLFGVIMVSWVALNSWVLLKHNRAFDPYPYILLNLFLSMLAAIQAPIILMSQNRQSEKDRGNAEHDYQVNLKAELEIMLLHEKMDLLRDVQWGELLTMQAEQLQLLKDLISTSPR